MKQTCHTAHWNYTFVKLCPFVLALFCPDAVCFNNLPLAVGCEVTLFKALWVLLPTRAESRLSILAVASLGLSAKDALASLMG